MSDKAAIKCPKCRQSEDGFSVVERVVRYSSATIIGNTVYVGETTDYASLELPCGLACIPCGHEWFPRKAVISNDVAPNGMAEFWGWDDEPK